MDAAHKMRGHTISAEPLVHNLRPSVRRFGLGQASGTREFSQHKVRGSRLVPVLGLAFTFLSVQAPTGA